MSLRIYLSIHLSTYLFVYLSICLLIYLSSYTHMYTHLCVYVYISIYSHMGIYILSYLFSAHILSLVSCLPFLGLRQSPGCKRQPAARGGPRPLCLRRPGPRRWGLGRSSSYGTLPISVYSVCVFIFMPRIRSV